MPTASLHSDLTRRAATTQQVPPADFIPLDQEKRTHVNTALLCWHIKRQPQTARAWASAETFPDGLQPLRVNNRLAWPVSGIKKILGVA
jgi:hypothetical protein